jgi:superfamily II DNA/RNA helicase
LTLSERAGFEALHLPEEVLRGVYASGYEKPSKVQQESVKELVL